VQAPNVQAPNVQAPDLPVSPPSAPQLPSGSDAVRVPSAPTGQASQPQSAGDQAGAAAQASTRSGAGGTTDGNRGSAARRGAGVAPPRSAGQLRLERVVRQRSACLPGLPSAQRRVVVLRSGYGPGRPRARRDVARMLDTGVQHVTRLERLAIEALGTDGPGGACSTGPAIVESAASGLLDILGLAGGLGTTGGGSGDAGMALVAGQSETGGESQPAANPSSRLPLGLPVGSPADLGWLFAIVMVVFFAAGVLRELFSRRSPRTTESPSKAQFAARRR
jgi:hypothetical protein